LWATERQTFGGAMDLQQLLAVIDLHREVDHDAIALAGVQVQQQPASTGSTAMAPTCR
jgi:hypothetical protein